MSSLLDDLWYSYQMEKSSRNTPGQQHILQQIVCTEDILRGELTEDQKSILEDLLSRQGQLHSLYEKTAFQNGIRFTLRFIAESIFTDFP